MNVVHFLQVKLQLSESQSQLAVVQKEAQAHKEELAQVNSDLICFSILKILLKH